MDPLSITASVAGILQLANTVFFSLTRYIKEAKDGKYRATGLAKEMMDLSCSLHRLSLLATAMDQQSMPSSFKVHGLESCGKTLLNIEKRVHKALTDFESDRKRDRLFGALAWPFSKHEMDDLLDEIARHKTSIGLALAADTMEALLKCLSAQSSIQQELKHIKTGIQLRNDADAEVQRDEERRDIINFFLKVNPMADLQTATNLRHSETGKWLLKDPDFHSWKSTHNSKLWLKGIPGAGKTILAGTVIEHLLDETVSDDTAAVAFFFCDYKKPQSQELANILGSITAQLATQSRGAFDVLRTAYHDCHPKHGLEKPLDPTTLGETILTMAEGFDKVFIVTDGVDECSDKMGVVADSLNMIAKTSAKVNMALFSREETEITEALSGEFEPFEIAAHTEDLELYVASQMSQKRQLAKLHMTNPGLDSEIRHSLVHGANGM